MTTPTQAYIYEVREETDECYWSFGVFDTPESARNALDSLEEPPHEPTCHHDERTFGIYRRTFGVFSFEEAERIDSVTLMKDYNEESDEYEFKKVWEAKREQP